ncbi:MAG: S9 family peptidase [Bacteroidia bacterium]|jgi:prolyl oligopeptidase|nr:prolyl oligopeptidase family serine peptidase [Bacteroidia bacterium]MCC6767409.1 S9 family peptidase [Bacteroidia bacterium]
MWLAKCLIISGLLVCTQLDVYAQTPERIKYPESRKDPVTEKYHGISVSDSFRWLENDTALDTRTWVTAQNKVTNEYLAQIPFRNEIKARITELTNFPRWSVPSVCGQYLFFQANSGLQEQPVLYQQQGLYGPESVFLDPSARSKGGTESVSIASFSKDKKYVALHHSKAGSDWSEIRIRDMQGKELPDVIRWVKFSAVTWDGKGFYYSRYPAPDKGNELSGINKHHSVYYHKLGERQEKDKLIYHDMEHPLRYHGLSATEDGRFQLLTISEGTDGYETWYRDLKSGDKQFKPLFTGFRNKNRVIDHQHGKLIVLTDEGAPHYRLVLVDPKKPSKDNWVELIKEDKNILQQVTSAGGKLFLQYMVDVTSRCYQYSLKGEREHEIQLPGLGTTDGFSGTKEDSVVFYSYTSFNTPPLIFSYNIKHKTSRIFRQPPLKFNPDELEVKQEFVTEADGVRIPIFIVCKKGLVLNGTNPTLLYGYGGFNISIRPQFNPALIAFIERGGVYVLANIRGGGEYGKHWHEAGMLEKKQNVFNDFIACAEYLQNNQYTSPSKLAIQGRSNGGLLVGAVMTQRPDLFRVAIPQVGVLDMLRFQKFTIGWGWVSEYGSSDDASQFKYLLEYSPLHNVTPAPYPATLITTADHDDRVVPAHSYKFAAALQQNQTAGMPVLIRIETDAGHGAGTALSKSIAISADVYSFILYNTK